MMGDVLFIVWRESVEALLVVGILYAWLRRQPDAARGLRWLWLGVGVGIGLACLLGAALMYAAQWFDGNAGDVFQLAMVLVACALIVQMVVWMRRHGRTLKSELEHDMRDSFETANWWGMVSVVALALAREGSETVIFLFGLGLQQRGVDQLVFAGSALAGFGLAFATFHLLQLGGRVLSWRGFFRVSEALLLLLGGSLLVTGVEKLIALDWLPALVDPLWDSSRLLDDGTRVGGIVAALTGYRAHPALMVLLLYALYWLVVRRLLRSATPRPPQQVAST
ncbi:high-affinity iron transporter [Plasticicumulans lactativorans]|uniref:High-affinity iron transporter n=2 Tax=Plasticicumulans lactativorans TaxID=1133106 RepID=A0A4R2L6X7_9GAMM|nr:high-affinity iron transporter [Plasticicumulans lactativorans]